MGEDKVYEVREAIADPSTVGLASFGIALFIVGFFLAGVSGANSLSVIVPVALITGVIHLLAAWYGFRKNELFTALVFGIYGMFWLSYCLINFGVAVKWFQLDTTALVIYLIAYTIFTLYVLIASFATNKAVIVTLVLLLVVFLLLDFGFAKFDSLLKYAGYVGIVCALCALYTSAAGLLGTIYGRSVLPVGPVKK